MYKQFFSVLLYSIIFLSTSSYGQESILSSGEIYKIEINQTGIYKLDYNYFNQIDGIDASNINPEHIAIFGNGGQMLAQLNEASRFEDLEENAIYVYGAEDGKFDPSDYVLFYGEGPINNRYSESTNSLYTEENYYDNSNYYFLKILSSPAKRIQQIPSLSVSDFNADKTEKIQTHNNDNKNLLGAFFSAHGSGKTWYGESFSNSNRVHDFSDKFNFEDIDLTEEIEFKTKFAVRSAVSSKMNIQIGNTNIITTSPSVNISTSYNLYAKITTKEQSILLDTKSPKIEFEFPQVSQTNEAWMDYIQIISSHNIIYRGSNIYIQNRKSIDFSSAGFDISNLNTNLQVWNITVPTEPKLQLVNGNHFNYLTNQTLQAFLLFDPNNAINPPSPTTIINQNLHGTQPLDMLIIYHNEFKDQAERLAQFRREYNNMSIVTVDVETVYNEFSSGKCDPTAIRDFVRYLKQKYTKFTYLLLFGDASYDYRGLTNGLPDHNFIPAYETTESLHPVEAFPSDDYYALLDNKEGNDLKGALDIAVGRLPANNIDQAEIFVDKIIQYETDPAGMGEWRLNLSFVADDEEKGGGHLVQTERISNLIKTNQPIFNQDKIYLDAYQQESTPGGDRYPAAREAINNNMFKGQLIYNYLGHGGPTGWAQERVLRIDDINQWQNKDKLCVMITATCSFAGYDDPAITTAGEAVFSQQNGGAVALLTTTRAVYAGSNERLATEVFNHIFLENEGQVLGLGEVLMMAKNTNKQDTLNINARKFTLLGDPAMRVAVPRYRINTTKINQSELTPESIDTFRALSIITVEGNIVDHNGTIIDDFNGTIIPTIFDKETSLNTLVNDGIGSERSFELQQSILFKGSATVKNGHFSYEFQMPKDIKFHYGNGKISHYASDGISRDAMGFYNQIIVGGTDTSIQVDNEGPIIKLFMNDNSFGYGGYTNTNPILYIELEDQSGINITGSSIGHNITGVLDDAYNDSFVMNQYYTAVNDNYKKGTVSYPLQNLSIGLHQIKVKAWDIHNNPTETIIEFNVIDPNDKSLYHVMNYPNPFVNKTNFRFEHGLPNTNVKILCQIYTISGKLVKTIESERFTNGQVIDDIFWNGKDDYGSDLAKGIYMYKIKLSAETFNSSTSDVTTIKKESKFEKLVIL